MAHLIIAHDLTSGTAIAIRCESILYLQRRLANSVTSSRPLDGVGDRRTWPELTVVKMTSGKTFIVRETVEELVAMVNDKVPPASGEPA